MKKTLLIILGVFVAASTFAQRNPQTLLGDGVEFTSGFGGFMTQFAPIKGDLSAMSGGGGALLLNNTFYFGGYGMGLADDITVTDGTADFDVSFGHGGLMMGFIIMPSKVAHLGISTKVGWGDISFSQFATNGTGFTGSPFSDNVFIVSPQAEIEVNMTSWFKVNASVGYQLANGVDNAFYTDNDFNGTTIGFSFLFGWFR
ncbi:MAG: hypothetical protein ACI8QD_000534 [Cyclobacteriaceae bacterium]|jgi:hypothetical protein